MKSLLLSAVCICVIWFSFAAQAALVTVEPDDFLPWPSGPALTDVVPGVTLSVADGSGEPQLNSQVVAFQSNYSSTGSLVFGRQVTTFVPDDFWFFSNITSGHSIFRADFLVPVNKVSIDIIRNGTANTGALLAYDVSGTLIDTAVVSLGALGTFTTATISNPTTDIAFILAGGYPAPSSPPFNVVALDNLQFNVIPIPPSVWLFGSGLLGLVGVARKKASK